jgi:hypothetical protein
VRKLAEMLMFQPELALRADPQELASDEAVADWAPAEMDLVRQLLVLGRSRPDIRALAAHFQETPLAALAEEVEAATIEWDGRRLDKDAVGADFDGAWRQLLERLRNARLSALLEKSKHGGWSAADKDLYRQLQRGAPATGDRASPD